MARDEAVGHDETDVHSASASEVPFYDAQEEVITNHPAMGEPGSSEHVVSSTESTGTSKFSARSLIEAVASAIVGGKEEE